VSLRRGRGEAAPRELKRIKKADIGENRSPTLQKSRGKSADLTVIAVAYNAKKPGSGNRGSRAMSCGSHGRRRRKKKCRLTKPRAINATHGERQNRQKGRGEVIDSRESRALSTAQPQTTDVGR